MRRSIWMALACLVLLAACDTGLPPPPIASGQPANVSTPSGSASPDSPSTQPSSPSASPSTGALTPKEAAAYYLAHVKLYNRGNDAAFRKYGKSNALKPRKAYWRTVAKLEDRWINSMKAVTWPDVAARDVRALIRAAVIDERRELAASRSKTFAALLVNEREAHRADRKTGDLASLVRDDLGLPSN